LEAQTACNACEKGKYGGKGKYGKKVRLSCSDCEIGKFQNKEASLLCLPCSPGKFQNTISSESCEDCADDEYQGERGSSSCKKRVEGYVVDSARISQTRIPEGSFRNGTASELCPRGYHGVRTRENCEACSRGTYSFPGAIKNKDCKDCDAGKFANKTGTSECSKCDENKLEYQDEKGKFGCKLCTEGKVPVGNNCENPSTNNSLPVPNMPDIVLLQSKMSTILNVSWSVEAMTAVNEIPKGYDVQLCTDPDPDFGKLTTQTLSEVKTNIIVPIDRPTWSDVTYVRVRSVGNGTQRSIWSLISKKWTVASDCSPPEDQYLNITGRDPIEWQCEKCPSGADCNQDSTIRNLFPKPNHWRVPWAPLEDQFERCPFFGDCVVSNGTDGCVNGTTGPLCAVCQEGYVRRNRCVECSSEDVAIRVVGVLIMFLLFFIVVCTQRARLRRLYRKYGALWRDIVRILTINISFMQINASLPSILDIEWPESYLAFLSQVNFVNFDILTVLGMPCVTPMDFRLSVGVAGLVPLCIALVGGLMYLHRRMNFKKSADMIIHHNVLKREAAQYLFDVLDVQESHTIDVHEFQHLLVFLGHQNSSKKHATKLMQTVLEHTAGTLFYRSKKELSRDQFLTAVTSGEIEGLTHSGNKWVEVVERERVFTSYAAGTMILFLLIHAPVSQQVFYYFDQHDVKSVQTVPSTYNFSSNGNWMVGDNLTTCGKFLRSDYSIEYGQGHWLEFLPITVAILLIFVLGLPLAIIVTLFRNRHHLHSPHNRRRLGFIYKPFVVGAEYWELHEVFRKMILMSLLIFVPSQTKAAIAILICVITVATLNYVRPHKNFVVFWVAETSFILTTFKYLTSIFIVTQQADGEYSQTKGSLGIVLIFLDVSMMLGSIVAMIAVGVLVKKAKKMSKDDGSISPLTDVVPIRKYSLRNFSEADIRKAAQHAKAERTEEEAEKAHNAAVQEIELHKTLASTRLQRRLHKRKKTIVHGVLAGSSTLVVGVLLLAQINGIYATCPSKLRSSDCSGSTLSVCSSRTCTKYPIYIDNVDKPCKNSPSYNGYSCCLKKGEYLLGSTTSFFDSNSYATKYVVCAVSPCLMLRCFITSLS
jgi:hypothetical protein